MTHSNERPARIEQLGMSTFAYNYDVQEVSVQTNENEPERIEYQYKTLVFDHSPTRNEVINRIVCEQYPAGEESALQRKGILNKANPEFIAYNEFVESTKEKIKKDFEENEAIQ